jgi:hypothetical protein
MNENIIPKTVLLISRRSIEPDLIVRIETKKVYKFAQSNDRFGTTISTENCKRPSSEEVGIDCFQQQFTEGHGNESVARSFRDYTYFLSCRLQCGIYEQEN